MHRRPNIFRERSFVAILLGLPKKYLDSFVIRRLVWYGVTRYVTMASYYGLLHWRHAMTCYNDIVLWVVTLASIYVLQWDQVICHYDPMLWDMSRCVHVMNYDAMTGSYGIAHDYTVLWCVLLSFTMTSLYVTTKGIVCGTVLRRIQEINSLNAELNPICYLLALLGAHCFLHVSRIRVKSLTLRLLMSYIYGAPILDVSRSHTTTHHSR